MQVEWLRGAHGEKRGVVLSWARGHVSPPSAAVQPRELEYWRICEYCDVKEAVVFCTTHALYFCSECLNLAVTAGECRFISVSAARALLWRNEVRR